MKVKTHVKAGQNSNSGVIFGAVAGTVNEGGFNIGVGQLTINITPAGE